MNIHIQSSPPNYKSLQNYLWAQYLCFSFSSVWYEVVKECQMKHMKAISQKEKFYVKTRQPYKPSLLIFLSIQRSSWQINYKILVRLRKSPTVFPHVNNKLSIEENILYSSSLTVLQKTVENKYCREPLYGICFQRKKQ